MEHNSNRKYQCIVRRSLCTDMAVNNVSKSRFDIDNTNITTSNGSALGYYEYYYYYSEPEPYTKHILNIELSLIGYVFPAIALPTVIFNILVILVFAKKKMRTPTSVLLIALAMTDTIVCLSILPASFYFFIGERYKSYLHYEWCSTEYILYVIQRMSRTASNWITVALGTQRFIIVCYPFKAKSICTVKSALMAVTAAVITSICIHITSAIAVVIQPLAITAADNESYPDGCTRGISTWYKETVGDVSKSLMFYYVFSGLLSRLLPCVILSVTTCLLVYKLKNRKREIGQSVNKTSSAESFRRITKLVLIVMVIFLIAESQDAFGFAILAYEYATDSVGKILTVNQEVTWSAVGMVISLTGYFFNFWIYILMSRQFREALFGYFTREKFCKPKREDRTQTTILNSSPSTKAKIYCNSDSTRILMDRNARMLSSKTKGIVCHVNKHEPTNSLLIKKE